MTSHYILDENKQIVPVESILEWSQWFQEDSRRVAYSESLTHQVSTVFLGINTRFDKDAPPLVFETMVFGQDTGWDELDCWRYSTWDEAVKGHEELCKKWNVDVNTSATSAVVEWLEDEKRIRTKTG